MFGIWLKFRSLSLRVSGLFSGSCIYVHSLKAVSVNSHRISESVSVCLSPTIVLTCIISSLYSGGTYHLHWQKTSVFCFHSFLQMHGYYFWKCHSNILFHLQWSLITPERFFTGSYMSDLNTLLFTLLSCAFFFFFN